MRMRRERSLRVLGQLLTVPEEGLRAEVETLMLEALVLEEQQFRP